MIESLAAAGPRLDGFDRARLARAADWLACAVAFSLPWSTSATGILVIVWFVTLLPTLEASTMRRVAVSAAGACPLILVGLATLGMSWAEVGWSERFDGLDGFVKLLFVPFLLAQFHRSPQGWWVVRAFFAASLVLLLVSWFLALAPGLPWRGKMIGVPVKDYISQSSIFALCAFALLGRAVELARSGQARAALAAAAVAAAFMVNILYVETSRTTLVTVVVLLLLLGLRQFGWKGMLAAAVAGGVLAGAVWMSSPYLRERVLQAVEDVQSYRSGNAVTSSGLRLEYWRNSIEAIARSPVIGSGTGTIPELLRADPSAKALSTVNPHNQILVVAIQLGLLGTAVLLAMWAVHLALFRGGGVVGWIGLVAVAQNVIGSLFNSHLSDFTHGWLYVLAVGVLGGMALRQADRQPATPPGGQPNGVP